MEKIEQVVKAIADNEYISSGEKYLVFVLGVPTVVRGSGNHISVKFADTMPKANKLEWGDRIINSLADTKLIHAYGTYRDISTKIGVCAIIYKFGSIKIKFG